MLTEKGLVTMSKLLSNFINVSQPGAIKYTPTGQGKSILSSSNSKIELHKGDKIIYICQKGDVCRYNQDIFESLDPNTLWTENSDVNIRNLIFIGITV